MKLVVGLGNTGAKYVKNRHNVGFMVVDAMPPNNKSVIFLKTSSMMNSSGVVVASYVKKYNLELKDLYIIHDDLDIPLGEYKIQFAKGPKVHNGVNSIEEALGTSEFWRVRVGIDNRDPESRAVGEGYVLSDFSDDEINILAKLIPSIKADLNLMING